MIASPSQLQSAPGKAQRFLFDFLDLNPKPSPGRTVKKFTGNLNTRTTRSPRIQAVVNFNSDNSSVLNHNSLYLKNVVCF